MTEEFLHFIYKNRLWIPDTELLTDNTPFEIIETGLHNHDSGPDFFNAKIKIDGIVWVGNVEIHVNSSDWHKHHHDNDRAYDNVILHIVYNHDCDIVVNENRVLPTWEISFSQIIYNRFYDFKLKEKPIACSDYINLIDDFHVSMWMEKMAIERLEYKTEYISEILKRTNNNWQETLYIILARNFGFGKNAIPFELLAIQTPSNILLHNADNIFILEAIIFGQAGLLNDFPKDDYTKKLADEYHFQKSKYNLEAIPKSLWKRSKMLPNNFPDVRLSQFAAVMQVFQKLINDIINKHFDSSLLYNLEVSEYWKTHYTLGEKSAKTKLTKIGKQTIDIILINTVIPFSYLYGKTLNSEFDSEYIIDEMNKIPSENNRETRAFSDIKQINCKTAYDSQALLNLKKYNCDNIKCLNCVIGFQIMKELNKF